MGSATDGSGTRTAMRATAPGTDSTSAEPIDALLEAAQPHRAPVAESR